VNLFLNPLSCMICDYCSSEFPGRIVVDGRIRNLSHRRYCLACSPFKAHRTRPIVQHEALLSNSKTCARCRREKPKEAFYPRRKTQLHPWCIECCKSDAVRRQRELKAEAIRMKGGCCQLCGYDKCAAALDFHHIDPSEKVLNVSQSRSKALTIAELEKCILVCVRCHREIEAGIATFD